ncbi:MAG: hypothetical protein QG594_1595, partial [Bacteroidota bacterium]|nr:hypothetical protein [Bacteroidota bacterium]
KICDYTKIPLNFKTFNSWNNKPLVPKSCKVLVVRNTLKMNQKGIDALLAFVAKGGSLFLIETTEDIRMGYFLGIKPRSDFEVDTTVKGVYFQKSVLPGMSGLSIKPKVIHFGLKAINFSKKVNVLAWANSDKKYPFYLENKIGAGKVVFFNSTQTLEKEDRGLLFSGILNGLKAIPYPVANTSTIFLDDFPSPTYDAKIEPIKSELNMTITNFVYSIWWPDMKKLAEIYGLKYTAMLTFDYRNKINPPFSFSQWDASRTKIGDREIIAPHWLVKDLEKHGFEKGFHGYNHVSLLKKGWPYPSAIQSSMKATLKKWRVNSYGNLPVAYVPPSNDIDAYGLKNLSIAMPSIKYMSSLYLGDLKDGGDREFDFEPYNNQFFDYPRISSGYDMTDNVYIVKSLYLFTGIWNHFVHPDDVCQIPKNMNKGITLAELRNPKSLGWRKTKGSNRSFYSLFNAYLLAQKEQFPLTQYATVANAVPQVMHWRSAKYTHTAQSNTYSVQEQSKGKQNKFKTSWFVYFEKQDYQKAESQIKKQTQTFSHTPFLNGRLYHIITAGTKLNFEGFYKPNTSVDFDKIKKEYDNNLKDQKLYLAGAFEPQGEDYDLKLKLEKAKLLAQMLSQPNIDYAVWDKYALYAAWDNKGDEVWELLKKHCQKYPSKHNVMYARNLAEILGYSTPDLQKYWITMQYKFNPDDLSILKEYLSIAYDAKDNAEIEKVLKKIYELEPIHTNLKEYLAFILINNKEEALKVVENIAPSPDFDQNLVADICWLYASINNNQKALDWSKHTDLIPFSSKLLWMYDLCMYPELIEAYQKEIAFCPDNYELKATMAHLYHAMGQFKNAWDLACSLPEGDEKNKLIQMLNKDVIYAEESLQDLLIKESPHCFTKEALAFINNNKRKMFGDFVETDSEYTTFSGRKISLTNNLSYNHYDKKKNLHTFKASNKNLYAFDLENLVENQEDPDNKDVMIHGLAYKFKSNNIKKWRNLSYFGALGLEINNESKPYFDLSIGAEINKDYQSSLAQLEYAPVNTSAAYEKNIYKLKATFYNNTYMGIFGLESSLELEYYNNPVIYNLMADSKMRLKPNFQKSFRASPIVELGILKSTASQDLFYPYFV